MYTKLIVPVLAVAALSFSANFLPIAHTAESLPGAQHSSMDVQVSSPVVAFVTEKDKLNTQTILNNNPVTASANIKIAFARPIVTSKPAPKPKPVAIPVALPSDNTSSGYFAAGSEDSPNLTQPTAGMEPWQISQMNAQNSYITTQSKIPFAVNPPAQSKGTEIVKIAGAHLGVPYVWGAESPVSGWDCSGYVQWVFAQAGVQLPRTFQWVNQTKVSPQDAQPGDLIVMNNGTHVGIYLGGGMMYSALSPSVGTLEHSTNIMKADYYRVK